VVIRYYTDENIHDDVAPGTRHLGLDTDSFREHGTFGWSDPRQLAKAVDLGRAIVTSNKKDFRRLHETLLIWRVRWNVPDALCHHGILIVPHVKLPDLIRIIEAFDGLFDDIDDRLFMWDERRGWYEVV
jgi:Domain of unknown function (DUF5615)